MRIVLVLLMSVVLVSVLKAQRNPESYRDSILAERHEKDLEFKDTAQSPLPDDLIEGFTGLAYFDVDTAFCAEAVFQPVKGKKMFSFSTSKGVEHPYRYYHFGTLFFRLKGKEYSLNVYASPDVQSKPGLKNHLFLPYTDLTSGNSSYGGGKYLDLEKNKSGRYTVDFNRAYNPYCAYGGSYLCPIPPPENFLDVEILAGEKGFE